MTQRRAGAVVIGGGAVGLATALALRAAAPDLPLVLIEKEPEVGAHQTGHNSGVIHAGVYYKPGSLKAKLCAEGRGLMEAFCEAEGVPFRRCGKVVVATSEAELPRLEGLAQRARANGLKVVAMGPAELKEREAEAAGLAALWVPETGVVDYGAVARAMKARLLRQGVEVHTCQRFIAVHRQPAGHVLETDRGELPAEFVVNCAGLHSDRIARAFGVEPGLQIIPFRGEYYHLRPEAARLVRTLIYPVPDPDLPFLGVHLTRGIHGEVEAGPNAVLAFAREGYRRSDLVAGDMVGYATYPGFWRMARRWWRTGCQEWYRSLHRGRFLRDLQTLVPNLRDSDLMAGGSGVRAQAVDPQGRLADDFVFVEGPGSLHVLNAPSPAATASLAIGKHVASRAMAQMASAL